MTTSANLPGFPVVNSIRIIFHQSCPTLLWRNCYSMCLFLTGCSTPYLQPLSCLILTSSVPSHSVLSYLLLISSLPHRVPPCHPAWHITLFLFYPISVLSRPVQSSRVHLAACLFRTAQLQTLSCSILSNPIRCMLHPFLTECSTSRMRHLSSPLFDCRFYDVINEWEGHSLLFYSGHCQEVDCERDVM